MKALVGRALLTLSAVAIGAAVVLLGWSVALALWAAHVGGESVGHQIWAAERRHYPGIHHGTWWALTPTQLTTRVGVAVGLLLIALVAALAWRAKRNSWMWLSVPAIATVTYVYFAGHGIVEYYEQVQQYPVTERIPAAVTAWWLLGVGAGAACVGAFAVRHLSRRMLLATALGMVIAVGGALVATRHALHAGDDSLRLDVTTATAAPVPPPPQRLGLRAFTIRISSSTDLKSSAGHSRPWSVEAAGAGFVTFGDGLIAAYGPDGTERWHYRRTNFSVSQIGVFDDGKTVIADYYYFLVGLDAVTGTQLWTSTDPKLVKAFNGGGFRKPDRTLLFEDADAKTWTGFDTRTGTEAWTIKEPVFDCPNGGCRGSRRPPGIAFACNTSSGVDVLFALIDMRTGQRTWENPVLQNVSRDSLNPQLVDAAAVPIGHAGRYAVETLLGGTKFAPTAFVDPAKKESRIVDWAAEFVLPTLDQSDEFLTNESTAGHPRVGIRDAQGNLRCMLPDEPGIRSMDDSQRFAVILGDEIVYDTSEPYDARGNLVTVRRTDCSAVGAMPAQDKTRDLVAAPGVTLLVRTNQSGTYVDGYR